jgi:membrane-bound ClpP family serine protease
MLLTIGLILIVLWFLGFIFLPALGWFIHILLIVAIIMILIRIIKGK